jgi:hypothetical protein
MPANPVFGDELGLRFDPQDDRVDLSDELAGWETAGRGNRISSLFSGSKEDQDFELFLNIVEPVFHFSLDENNSAGAYLGKFGSDLHMGTSPNDVVHLVLAVRLLRIDPAFRQNINAGAHGRDPKEFEVEFVFPRPLAIQIVDVKGVGHGKPLLIS